MTNGAVRTEVYDSPSICVLDGYLSVVLLGPSTLYFESCVVVTRRATGRQVDVIKLFFSFFCVVCSALFVILGMRRLYVAIGLLLW